MKEIMTVLGPIAPEELGFTSMHERILMDGRTVWWREELAVVDAYPISGNEPLTLENVFGYMFA